MEFHSQVQNPTFLPVHMQAWFNFWKFSKIFQLSTQKNWEYSTWTPDCLKSQAYSKNLVDYMLKYATAIIKIEYNFTVKSNLEYSPATW